jgi:ribosomal protein S18 acetylase RimI-like enzyme
MVAALTVKPEPAEERLMLISLLVDPDYRRLGLGRKLAEQARRVAQARALKALAMPVEAENATGAAFLGALGFTPLDHGAPFFVAPEDGRLWSLSLASLETP